MRLQLGASILGPGFHRITPTVAVIVFAATVGAEIAYIALEKGGEVWDTSDDVLETLVSIPPVVR